MMKAWSLLLLRFSTGSYLIIWGLIKLAAKDKAVGVSNKYYDGIINGDIANYGLGILEMLIGLLVVLGLFRKYTYPLQALIYFVGLAAIAPYIIDPFGFYIASEQKVTFYPSTTLFFASLVMIAFKSDDTRVLEKS
ncbi:DoxX family membrane protein [Kordiimonas sp. SCSIO 12610]|uniref:DoxX family membrane protein n=1 Tax=Kordiimonas sp. SCSIO 12610 TaxID=2829597 RepID=UPI00210D9C20|nr:DoxX family membrane protein [Kordiimonas sp. SCSIO 12610]UTW56806.1 DoxX family membrane protein [Kordiimonas sp. SCSIO 12610]